MWVPGSILLSALPTNLAGWIFLHRTGLRIRLGLHTERWWALMVGILTTAQVLVPLALGVQYAESARLLPWLAPYVVVAPLAAFFSGTVLYALGKHREYLISTATGAAVAVVAYLALVPLGGIRGASVAFVLGEAVVAAVAYRLAPQAAREVWSSPLLKVGMAGTALMAVALVAARLLRDPTLAAAVASGILYVIFCGWQSRARIQAELQRSD